MCVCGSALGPRALYENTQELHPNAARVVEVCLLLNQHGELQRARYDRLRSCLVLSDRRATMRRLVLAHVNLGLPPGPKFADGTKMTVTAGAPVVTSLESPVPCAWFALASAVQGGTNGERGLPSELMSCCRRRGAQWRWRCRLALDHTSPCAWTLCNRLTDVREI